MWFAIFLYICDLQYFYIFLLPTIFHWNTIDGFNEPKILTCSLSYMEKLKMPDCIGIDVETSGNCKENLR
jgi:hypothetical protein